MKIDRSFVADITTDTNVTAIIGAIAAMAKKMNLAVVAEGVESQEQAELLVEQGCDCMQGYLVSRPLAVDDYEQFLRSWASKALVPAASGAGHDHDAELPASRLARSHLHAAVV